MPTPSSSPLAVPSPHRILVVDDNPGIHSDFLKVLSPRPPDVEEVSTFEGWLFPTTAAAVAPVAFDLDSAFQGQEAENMVRQALQSGQPYALAFVDVRMPPGWDGIETIEHLWRVDPSLQVVICTAFADYSWDAMRSRLGQPESFVVLKKPFDNIEVQQLAHALTRKWELNLQAETAITELQSLVTYLGDTLGNGHPPKPVPPPDSPPSPPAPASHPSARRPQLADLLIRLRKSLERTVRQIRDTQVLLVHAEKMASLGRMSAAIVHEISNPLNYALTAIQLARRYASVIPANSREEYEETTADIRDCLQRIALIVKDLRTFNHPQYGDLTLVNVREVLGSALRILTPEFRDQVEVENLVPDDFEVHAVPGRLTQVFLNLLQNAIDALRTKAFGPGQRPQIRIEAGDDQGTKVVRVWDNGPGIPAGDQQQVFEPFFTTKDAGRGTGLGLSICYRLMQDVGASLSVRSEEHRFCEFTLAFPAQPQIPVDSPLADPSRSDPKP